MRPYDIIMKKRNGEELSKEEIRYFIQGYTKGEIPDYQMAALAMAVYFRGMTQKETTELTLAMAYSGDTVDLSSIVGKKVDKHSTGGVADTTTLVAAPLVAAAGAPVAKMSGRGLGHTGGTIDKLESIPGFRTEAAKEEFVAQVNRHKIAVIGQSADLAPADKKLYALRDVTATIDSIPLIASSVMSKKIAAGADAIVLDVKVGSGAFMKDVDNAVSLAKAMVSIGRETGRDTVAVVTDMDQPLGNAIGNSLEVEEAIQILRGDIKGGDLLEVSLTLGSQMLYLSGVSQTPEAGRKRLEEVLHSRAGLKKLQEMIESQGGDPKVIENTSLLPKAKMVIPLTAWEEGFIEKIQADLVGISAALLGAGRQKKEDMINLSVGIILQKRVGDRVEKGEVLAFLHGSNEEKLAAAQEKMKEAYIFGKGRVEKRPLIHQIIG